MSDPHYRNDLATPDTIGRCGKRGLLKKAEHKPAPPRPGSFAGQLWEMLRRNVRFNLDAKIVSDFKPAEHERYVCGEKPLVHKEPPPMSACKTEFAGVALRWHLPPTIICKRSGNPRIAGAGVIRNGHPFGPMMVLKDGEPEPGKGPLLSCSMHWDKTPRQFQSEFQRACRKYVGTLENPEAKELDLASIIDELLAISGKLAEAERVGKQSGTIEAVSADGVSVKACVRVGDAKLLDKATLRDAQCRLMGLQLIVARLCRGQKVFAVTDTVYSRAALKTVLNFIESQLPHAGPLSRGKDRWVSKNILVTPQAWNTYVENEVSGGKELCGRKGIQFRQVRDMISKVYPKWEIQLPPFCDPSAEESEQRKPASS